MTTLRANLLATTLGLVLGFLMLSSLAACGGGDGASPFDEQHEASTQPVNCNAQPTSCH